jgi:ATP-dependent DNA helicase PIF1
VVEIPDDICIHHYGNLVADIVPSTYPSLIEGMQDISFFQNRVVLAPTFDLVEKVNDYVMSLIPAEGKECFI